ncbi:MAG TPA: hypothetical protein VLC96_13890, partial [Flavobacterium sp.]|nr:hypothetical protein [Flavobacterium sp.]
SADKKLSPTFSTSRWNGILYSKSNQHITLSKVVNNFTMLYIGVAVTSRLYFFSPFSGNCNIAFPFASM